MPWPQPKRKHVSNGERQRTMHLLIEVPVYCREEHLPDVAAGILRDIHLGVNMRAKARLVSSDLSKRSKLIKAKEH